MDAEKENLMNTANNKRRQTTRARIEKEFIRLIQDKDLDRISVTDICRNAGINRSTFYDNYDDVYQLADKMRRTLEEDFLSLYTDEIKNRYNSNDYLKLFRHIYENQIVYKTYFKLGYEKQVKTDVYDTYLAEKFFGGKHVEYHIEFFRAGITAIIKMWLKAGCKESPEEMARILAAEYQGREL